MDELSPPRDRLYLVPVSDGPALPRPVDCDDPLAPGWEDFRAARDRFFAVVNSVTPEPGAPNARAGVERRRD